MQVQVNTDSHIEGGERLTHEVEAIVHQALDRFSDRITRVEVYLSDENSSQKSGDNDKRCVIEVRLGGLRPITVSHQESSLGQAVSGATGKLEKTLKRTLGRKGSLVRRGVRQRAELTAALPLLERDAETGDREDFLRVLRPLLDHLGDHARRELRILEATGALAPGELIVSDVLDELVTRAWLQFADHPPAMSLELWLTRILDDIVEERAHQGQPIQQPLHQRSGRPRPQRVPQVAEQEWWIWLLDDDEVPAQEDKIVSRHSAWAEEFLEAEELVSRIHASLADLPKLQRQAFVLNVLEAYEPFEVAMLQERSESDVQADVQAARNHLRQQLRAGTPPDDAADETGAVANALAKNR
jgi:DNA-directed RNA polymerase specialized sigma24 family protein/ribosome-associated translation inhibitor RaiA